MTDTIRGWLNNKNVLVTGGTGYLGKGLIEKLLRTTEVRRIYLIIRSKNEIRSAARWQQVSQNLVFTRLLREKPDAFSKVVVLNGDMAERGLGLCDNDKEELCNNVAVVFHAAACVRFDDPLSSAVLLNIRGTKELLDLAKSMKKLECFQYVSTAYSTPKLNDDKIEEVLYPQQYDWSTLINIAERDGNLLNILQDKIITVHPNTYTFTKSVAETMLQQTKDNLPVVIIRPSVVVGSLQEPEPGWVDNLNGPVGIACGVTAGVLRVMRCNTDTYLDYAPIDLVINGMITIAWVISNKRSSELVVYNCTYGDKYQLCYRDIKENGEKLIFDYACNNNIWFPFCVDASNTYYYHFLFYTLQVLPGWFLDTILIIFRKKPIFTKLNVQIYKASKALYYFNSQQIEFNNSNYKSVFNLTPPMERDDFYLNFNEISKSDMIATFLKGMKKFILKEKEEDLDKFIAKLWRLYYVHTFTKGILLAGISWYLIWSFIW